MGLERRWFPVRGGEEAAACHIVHTALLGRELAVWRADDGTVNAWENRCPHRGVRLSIGTNLGNALKCRYHGWTYETGSGQCIEWPAHPGEMPPALVKARAFPCVEDQGYVWVRLSGEEEDDSGPEHPTVADVACFPCVALSEEGGIPRMPSPAVRRWLDRVKRIPGFIPMPGIFPA